MTRLPLTLALCQIDTTPGDIPGNLAKIRQALNEAEARGSRLAVFPELALLGYSPRDLLFRDGFLAAAERACEEIAAWSEGCAILVGTAWRAQGEKGPLWNAALLFDGGELVSRTTKTLLPHYDVFDERRWFQDGEVGQPFSLDGWRLGVTICEDLWFDVPKAEAPKYERDPVGELAQGGADAIINISASPYAQGKPRFRRELVARNARRVGRPILLCNLVGGNDELLFDGASCVSDSDGTIAATAPAFEESILSVELREGGVRGETAAWPKEGEELRSALVLGIADYARKCSFEKAVLGLSGGIDSAVAACLCVEALGSEAVQGLAMPSGFSSQGSRDDAADLARRLGIEFCELQIQPAYELLLDLAQQALGPAPFGALEENLQARIRGLLLMGVSNRRGSLLISTGNKSELAVGYCTLYGDMSGGLAAISDVYKGDVYRLGRIYEARGMLPTASLEKPPSAELRPDQLDEDSLPPYPILDQILRCHIEESLGTQAILDRLPTVSAETVSWVLTRVAGNEFKRKQAAPGLRVSSKAFGYGRRIPIVSGNLAWLAETRPTISAPASDQEDGENPGATPSVDRSR